MIRGGDLLTKRTKVDQEGQGKAEDLEKEELEESNSKSIHEDEAKKNELSQPHDLAFKKLFGEVKVAKDVIKKNLPKEVLEQLDLDSLERLDGSFISKKLKKSFTDLLYGVKLNKREAYISFLWEHKSYKDRLTAFQVAGYIIDIWKQMIEDNKKDLAVVIPIVVYHGEENWTYKTDIRELIPDFDLLPAYLKEMLPVINHELVNITSHTAEEIKEYEPVTRLIMRVFKYIRAPKDKLLETIVISIDEVGKVVSLEELAYYIDIILLYFSATNREFTEAEIRDKIRQLDGRGSEIMTILQEREQRGLEQGLELGLQKGLEEGKAKEKRSFAKKLLEFGDSIEKIAMLTGLSENAIEEIKDRINN